MKRKPNILIFFTDQERHDAMGSYGNPLPITPNFDGWSREGVLCENAISPQPICMPARACLLTGKYASQNGCMRNGIPLHNRENHSVAEYFRDAGYDTGYIGKWHLCDQPLVPKELRYGFDSWLASNALEFSSSAYDLVLFNEENEPVFTPGHRIDGIADRTIEYLQAHQEKPFFLMTSFLEPHGQNHINAYVPPRFWEQRWQGRWMPPDLATLVGSAHAQMPGYLALVERLDMAFGRIMDALLSMGMLDNTIVVFASDHGEHFMTRNTTHKMSPHEASVHVPLMFHGPGFTGGRRLKELVSLVDLAPTLLDAAGIPAPEDMSGQSILPLLHGGAKGREGVLIQTSEIELGRTIRTERWKYGVTAPQCDPLADTEATEYTEAYLFDLQNDPYELCNLITSTGFDHVKEHLRRLLLEAIVDSGEPLPAIIPAAPQRQPHGILPQLIDPTPEKLANKADPHRYMKPWDKPASKK